MRPTTRTTQGFTLIELMVVISIISLLSAIIFGAVSTARLKATDVRRAQDIITLRNALNLYYLNNGSYPNYTASCIGVQTGTKCWNGYVGTGGTGINGNTTLMSDLAPYLPTPPLDPDPTRSIGDRYIYFKGPGDVHCTGPETIASGIWLAWEPSGGSPSSDAQCKIGTTACCSGLSCSSTSFCLLQIDK